MVDCPVIDSFLVTSQLNSSQNGKIFRAKSQKKAKLFLLFKTGLKYLGSSPNQWVKNDKDEKHQLAFFIFSAFFAHPLRVLN
jgi:hypothetical protein